jgi:RNA polymerase sigma-70 factor (ECF subfamily)
MGASPAVEVHPALVNGTAGAVITMRGQPFAVMAFTVAENKIVEIDTIADPDRFATLAAPVLADPQLEPRVISQTVQAASG